MHTPYDGETALKLVVLSDGFLLGMILSKRIYVPLHIFHEPIAKLLCVFEPEISR